MTGGLDEEETAVDTGVLDVSLALGGKFFAQVCRVLILDILDDRVPAERSSEGSSQDYNDNLFIPSIIIYLITIPRSIDNIEPQTDAVFLDY